MVSLMIDDLLFIFDTWSFRPMDNSTTIDLGRDNFFKFTAHFKIKNSNAPSRMLSNL